jgi:hypothetical protein
MKKISKKIKIIILIIFSLLFILFGLFFLIPNNCENDFRVYQEEGYCEFNLKVCEGLFGCKEYNNVQVPCGSISTLCGEKVLCNCGDEKELLSNSAYDTNILKKESIDWLDYESNEYGFVFSYPSLSIDNGLWGYSSEDLSAVNVLLPNQVLSKGNNFYLHQKYKTSLDWQAGEFTKTENTFVPEYDNTHTYPLAWHIVILNANDEASLDKAIKQKLGSGCSYKTKIPTKFSGNYRIEINGDGKDLGSSVCPVNYTNYIIYSPNQGKVAFWSTGQECQIGLNFSNCFDEEIANSFHFID